MGTRELGVGYWRVLGYRGNKLPIILLEEFLGGGEMDVAH